MVPSIRGTTLNKGEWAEFYVLLTLLGEGRLYTANKYLQRNINVFLEVVKIIRQEAQTGVLEYRVDKDTGVVSIVEQATNNLLAQFPMEDFSSNATTLFYGIKNERGASIEAPDSVCDFAQYIYVSKPKAPSVRALQAQFGGKNDIFIEVRDGQTSITSIMGFSIKSKFGQPPTLFNAGSSSQLLFKVSDCDDSKMDGFNRLYANKSPWDDCREFLSTHQMRCSFVSTQHPIFGVNLSLVRESMAKILGECVYERILGAPPSYCVKEIIEGITARNSLGVPNPHVYYKKAIKDFLMAGFAGMTAGRTWNGEEQVNGGYIVVMEDGEVLCYHSVDREGFREYLYRNTFFEYVSRSEDKYNWGKIIKKDGEYYLPLNFSIRFNRKVR